VTADFKRPLLTKTSRKAGLGFDENQIVIRDKQRWAAVSMIHRPSTRMPGTTKSIESMNGQLNRATTRSNPFSGSLSLLAEMRSHKLGRFREFMQRGFMRVVKKEVKRAELIREDQMQRERQTCRTSATTALVVRGDCCGQFIAPMFLAVRKSVFELLS
jgi:hypothetical protein